MLKSNTKKKTEKIEVEKDVRHIIESSQRFQFLADLIKIQVDIYKARREGQRLHATSLGEIKINTNGKYITK